MVVDEIYEIEENEVLVCISWGDWRYQHLACDHIMKQLGYLKVQEVVTENNGTDCYSSEHTFTFKISEFELKINRLRNNL